MMKKQEFVKIGSIAEFNKRSYSVKSAWPYVNYLDTGSITKNAISDIQHFSDAKKIPNRARRIALVGDILYSNVRPNQLHYGLLKEIPSNFLVSTGFTVISPDTSMVDGAFLYYYLIQDEITQYLQTIAEQSVSTYPTLRPEHIAGLEISLPPLSIQRKIAAVLGTLDDKIELNRQINDNLLRQAQTILKYYEQNYESKTVRISEIAVINPESYSLKEHWENICYLDTSSITNGLISDIQHINPNKEKLPSRARRKIKANDVVFSTVRPDQHHFGIIANPFHNMLVSTGFAVLRSCDDNIRNEHIYLSLIDEAVIAKLQQLAEQSTSTYPSIRPSDIGDCTIQRFSSDVAKNLNPYLRHFFKAPSKNLCISQMFLFAI